MVQGWSVSAALRRLGRLAPAGAGRTRSRSGLIINGEALLADDGAARLRLDGVDAVFRSIDELAFTIGPGRVRVQETVHGRDLEDFGLVQVAAYPRPTATLLNAVAEYLRARRVRAVNMDGIGAPTKLFQYTRFALAGLPVPATRYLPPRLLARSYQDLADQLGRPFVVKSLSAGGGRCTHLIRNEGELADRLRDGVRRRVPLLAQEFIPIDTTLRLLVLGGDLAVVMRRTRAGAALVASDELDPAARRLAVRAAGLLGYDVAGVVLVRHWTTRRWTVLYATSTPAIGSGAFVGDKLGAYSSYVRRRLGIGRGGEDRGHPGGA